MSLIVGGGSGELERLLIYFRGELAPPPPDVLETTPDLHWRIRLLIVRMEFEARGGDWEGWLDEMTFREDSSSEDY